MCDRLIDLNRFFFFNLMQKKYKSIYCVLKFLRTNLSARMRFPNSNSTYMTKADFTITGNRIARIEFVRFQSRHLSRVN